MCGFYWDFFYVFYFVGFKVNYCIIWLNVGEMCEIIRIRFRYMVLIIFFVGGIVIIFYIIVVVYLKWDGIDVYWEVRGKLE